jgi:hypothetical protein
MALNFRILFLHNRLLLASALFASTLGSLTFSRAPLTFSAYSLTTSITRSASSRSSPIFRWHGPPFFSVNIIVLILLKL